MSRIKRWTRIPDGSTLSVKVTGDDGFVAQAILHDELDFEEEWTDAQLNPGPVAGVLKAPRLYAARVTVVFAQQTTATVTAEVTKPGGSRLGDVYTCPLSAASGAKIVTLFAITKQSS